MNTVLLAALAIALGGAQAKPDGGAPRMAKLHGKVRYQHAARLVTDLADHEVQLLDPKSEQPVATTKTDAQGNYQFEVKPGQYVLKTSFAKLSRVAGDTEVKKLVELKADESVSETLSATDGTRCLSGHAHIETPAGEVEARKLALGSEVWTRDPTGARVPGRVVGLQSSAVEPEYQPLQLTLSDGRAVVLSTRHPLADGRPAGSVRTHETLDGAEVRSAALVAYDLPVTYDLLVDGGDGTYWADGIALGSTMQPMLPLLGDAGP